LAVLLHLRGDQRWQQYRRVLVSRAALPCPVGHGDR
jgi:hypothetical protein